MNHGLPSKRTTEVGHPTLKFQSISPLFFSIIYFSFIIILSVFIDIIFILGCQSCRVQVSIRRIFILILFFIYIYFI